MAKEAKSKSSRKHKPRSTELESVPDDNTPAVTTTHTTQEAEDAFAAYYLSRVTTEFADDLDKIRTAPDFRGDASLPLLIYALQQGSTCFQDDERLAVGHAMLGHC